MKYFVLSLLFLLTACSTVVPARQDFPEAPKILFEKCPNLLTIDDDKNTLKDMLKIVIQNYSTYYQCAEKAQGWQEWYDQQKKIYKEAGQ